MINKKDVTKVLLGFLHLKDWLISFILVLTASFLHHCTCKGDTGSLSNKTGQRYSTLQRRDKTDFNLLIKYTCSRRQKHILDHKSTLGCTHAQHELGGEVRIRLCVSRV